MNAAEILNMIYWYQHQSFELDKESKEKLIKIFDKLNLLKTCGDNEKHILWINTPRGDFEEYLAHYNDECEEYGEEKPDEKELRESFFEDFPDDTVWYKIVTVHYNDYYSLFINGTLTLSIDPSRNGFPGEANEILDWLTERISAAIDEIKAGTYAENLIQNIPKRKLFGSIDRAKLYKICPSLKDFSHREMSEKDKVDFLKFAEEQKAAGKKVGTIKGMSFGKYLDICALGWVAIEPEETKGLSPAEMYRKYADNRDGGLSGLDPDSEEEFSKWYHLSSEEKWKIDNPSHLWEVVEGSSMTRVHLYVGEKAKGEYNLRLSGPASCVPYIPAKFYIALRKAGIPVYLYNINEYIKLYSEEGKIGIIPDYYSSLCDSVTPADDIFECYNSDSSFLSEEAMKQIEWMPPYVAELAD